VLFGHGQRLGHLHDAQLFTLDSNESHLWDTDFTVDAMFFLGCDVENS